MKVSNKSSNPMQGADAAKGAKITADSVDKKGNGSTAAAGFDSIANSDSAKVALSPRAQELKKAKELATPHGDINEAKVARLQKLIDEGKYKVDSEAVADRLVDEHFSMDS